jgi:isoquinoline 1-oxidoreductase beta subunit
MRQAGATARAMLVTAAAAEWSTDAAGLRTDKGFVIHTDGRRLSYGQLTTRAAALPVPEKVTLKNPQDFRLLGKSLRRTDLAGKVNGSAQFGLDVRVPGMLTAVVLRAPVIGAKVASVNSSKALAVRGVKQVLQYDGGVAVLATDYFAAKSGREALDVKWAESPNKDLSSAAISKGMADAAHEPGMVARDDGNVDTATAAKVISAVYEAPYLAHACMEPLNCTASVTDAGVEIWAPTQSPGLNRMVLAGVAGVAPEKVKVNVTYLGGGFGRRFAQDFAIEAVVLAKMAHVPVQLIYSREDDMHAQHYRPAARAELRGGVDAAGKPVFVSARTICSSVFQSAGMAKPGTLDEMAVEGVKGLPYDIPNVRVAWSQYEPAIKVWFWRSVGNSQNAFFAETFVDELAHAAGKDPFEFRRDLLDKQPRHKAVLELAASKAGWGKPLPAGRARGIAVTEAFGSYVAEVAEVSLARDGTPRVHRVVCAVDCGMTVNPAIITRQAQSSVMYGLSAALYGRITIKDGAVEQGNFNDYPVVRIDAAPIVEVHIVPSNEAPGGMGEPALPPLAPAVGNALFALNGKRHRSLPFSPA